MADEDDKKTTATWALLGLNVSVFLAMILAGVSPWRAGLADLTAAGGVDPGRVWNGEIWRLLTACFVHLGVWHLALNMWVLLQVGRALEQMVGAARLLLIYAATGVFGFAVSVALASTPTAGASGAIFGITGALLALALIVRHKSLGRLLIGALLPFVGATFALGFLVPFIDNTAHVGGLVFGFLLGYGLSAGDRSFLGDDGADVAVGPREKLFGTVVLAASGVLFAVVVLYAGRPLLSPRYQAVAGLEALLHKRVDEAKKHAAAAARLAPDDPATFFLLGRIKSETGDDVEGKRLIHEGLLRLHDDDMEHAIEHATLLLSLYGGDDEELPWSDLKTANALCDAALAEVGTRSSPEVKNDCAWIKAKAPDPEVRDPVTALALARAAVAESGGKDANMVHTLAVALSDNGDAAEGLALLQKLAAEGRADELSGGDAFLTRERERLKRIADGEDKVESH